MMNVMIIKRITEDSSMSFADELKKSMEYDPNSFNESKVKNRINRSVDVIKRECRNAAENGKNRVEGFVYLWGDSEYITEISKDKAGLYSGVGILHEDFNKDEEKRIIEGIREEVKKLGFDSCTIESYHPKRVVDGSKKVGAAIFRPQKRVLTYRNTDGFCIEVHVKW